MADEPKKRRPINRQDHKTPMPEQAPEARIRNYKEVPLGYTPEMAMNEATRCLQCKKAPCRTGCPVDIDIPAALDLIAEGDFAGGYRKMRETNFLPAICGRVCPQEDQCESMCVLGKKNEPVAIGRLERFVADWAMQHEDSEAGAEMPVCKPATGKKVAVIGSGPASLTAASDLVQLGHEVHVFEALHKPGGVLFYGIPEFRLPKAILVKEIDGLAKIGVTFHMNYVVGATETLSELRERFDAVFIGTGAGLPWFLGIPGENLNGVYSSNEFLTRVNLMGAYKFPESDTPVKPGSRVVVVGAGNTAMDSARTAKRLQPEHVTLVYRRSRAEMPARVEEIHHAEEEGIEFKLLHTPVEIFGDEKGNVTSVKLQKMELGEPDASGRRRPLPIEDSEFVVEADCVVVALGNGPNPLLTKVEPELELSRRGTIVVDEETLESSMKGVFAGGDIVTGGATVILAMGAGRQAARSIQRYLTTGSAAF
jgi:glutamate synthase (NADPH/NADH) small chain